MIDKEALKAEILAVLEEQGFKINPHVRPPEDSKEWYRSVQTRSRLEQISLHKTFLSGNINLAGNYCRDGKDISPEDIKIELREIIAGSKEERLYRWWNFMWWSIPFQRSYGRQMRFLLWDTTHNSPFGLICLQSPILKMSVRDKYLNIPQEELDIWVNRSMSAQRVGALPPYNELLGGKMVALSLTCNEIREAYRAKYSGYSSWLKNRYLSPDLLFITTTSAFGRSSIYNRLKYKGDLVAECLGKTQGSGSFHVPENIYLKLIHFLEENGKSYGRFYGNGPSRKLKIISQGFSLLGIPSFEYHGLKREFYLFPLAKNLKQVISHQEEPIWIDRPFNELLEFWKAKWSIPRIARNPSWQSFKKNQFFDNAGVVLNGTN
jgi:hypothetical protein